MNVTDTRLRPLWITKNGVRTLITVPASTLMAQCSKCYGWYRINVVPDTPSIAIDEARKRLEYARDHCRHGIGEQDNQDTNRRLNLHETQQ